MATYRVKIVQGLFFPFLFFSFLFLFFFPQKECHKIIQINEDLTCRSSFCKKKDHIVQFLYEILYTLGTSSQSTLWRFLINLALVELAAKNSNIDLFYSYVFLACIFLTNNQKICVKKMVMNMATISWSII